MPKVQLVITMEENGHINVNGPIENKILCFGLLKIVEKIIMDFQPPKVIVPNIVVPNSIRDS